MIERHQPKGARVNLKWQPRRTLEPELTNRQWIHRPIKTKIKHETQVQQ
jgi:hypothetical protein